MQGHCVKFSKTTRTAIISSDDSQINGWVVLFTSRGNNTNMTQSFCEVYIMGLIQADPTINKA
jgi:hypothetical protein